MPVCVCTRVYVSSAYNSRCIQLRSSVSSPDSAACKNSVVVAVSTRTSSSPRHPAPVLRHIPALRRLVEVVLVVEASSSRRRGAGGIKTRDL